MSSWKERIVDAMERGRFDEVDKCDVAMWETCKVGEKAAQYPDIVVTLSDSDHRPLDRELWNLGLDFGRAVEEDRVEAADAIDDAIDARVMVMKRKA